MSLDRMMLLGIRGSTLGWGLRTLKTSTRRMREASPLEQVRRMGVLQREVAKENSKSAKERMIGEYPELRGLLEHVYGPNHRTHLSSASLLKYRDGNHTQISSKDEWHGPTSLTALFDELSSRRVTGNAAKDLVLGFLAHYGIKEEAELAVFYRLLDRNLVAGFGARTLMQVRWADRGPDAGPEQVPAQSTAAQEPRTAASPHQTQPLNPPRPFKSSRGLKAFSCALGKTVLPPFAPLFNGTTWYASRKLDGVRCLTFLDFDISQPGSPRLVKIQHLSRTGKPFHTLRNLEPQLRLVEHWPGLEKILSRDPEVVDGSQDGGEGYKRLVLDGEGCVMVPSPAAPATSPPAKDMADRSGSAIQLWTETGLVEDFPATVSEIRRHRHSIERPAYYLFDMLSYAEFDAGTSLPRMAGLGQTFSGRLSDLQDLCTWLNGKVKEGGAGGPMVHALKQEVVKNEQEVEGMVETAAKAGWEGLVLRADKGYIGKRSTDVRKFKQWQDAEYIVTGVDVSRQRLAVDGTFGEYEAVAAVHIGHKGHHVAVGSGLTEDQRIRWAKDPSEIVSYLKNPLQHEVNATKGQGEEQQLNMKVGKQITVEYFSESEALGRQGTTSLRFPRIKTVWDGKRDI